MYSFNCELYSLVESCHVQPVGFIGVIDLLNATLKTRDIFHTNSSGKKVIYAYNADFLHVFMKCSAKSNKNVNISNLIYVTLIDSSGDNSNSSNFLQPTR